MKLSDMKVGDVVPYSALLGVEGSEVKLTLTSLTSDGKTREGVFKASFCGIRLGTVTARESGELTKWSGVSL